MIINFKTSNVNYEMVGSGKCELVFLHGWGGSTDSFKFICRYLKCDYKALFIDFPPFGKSTEMKIPWTLFDYAELVIEIMKKEKIEKPIIIGHSFGGRVASVLSAGGYAKKLILVDSAGLKPKRTLKYYFKNLNNKIRTKLGKKTKGSADYEKLCPIMKKTFVNIVNTFLEKYVINIIVPTIIFWGQKDKETPLYMAKRFKNLIKNSELVVIKNAGHFAYLQDLTTFVNVVNFFISQN